MELQELTTKDEVHAYVREQVTSAENEILLAIPAELLPTFESELATAKENGVFIAILLYGDPSPIETEIEYADVATLVRVWDVPVGLALLHVDQGEGMITSCGMLLEGGDVAVTYDDIHIYHMGFPMFLAQQWSMGEEVFVADPEPLPHEFPDLRDATVQGTIHLREDNIVGVKAEVRPAPASEGDEYEPIDGQLVTTRQNFIHPSTSSFYGEMTLLVRTPEGRFSMGGVGAYFEDFEARSIRFYPREEPVI